MITRKLKGWCRKHGNKGRGKLLEILGVPHRSKKYESGLHLTWYISFSFKEMELKPAMKSSNLWNENKTMEFYLWLCLSLTRRDLFRRFCFQANAPNESRRHDWLVLVRAPLQFTKTYLFLRSSSYCRLASSRSSVITLSSLTRSSYCSAFSQ